VNDPKHYPTKKGIGHYHIIAQLHENGYSYSFECYRVAGENDGVPIYDVNDDVRRVSGVPDPERCDPEITGQIKWDGCADITFEQQQAIITPPEEMGPNVFPVVYTSVHFCGREDARKIERLFDRLWAIAAELIPHWDRNQ
jgi:hypothetical protein